MYGLIGPSFRSLLIDGKQVLRLYPFTLLIFLFLMIIWAWEKKEKGKKRLPVSKFYILRCQGFQEETSCAAGGRDRQTNGRTNL